MVEATNKIGHAAGIHTIAEFAENQGTISALHRIDADYAQGLSISDLPQVKGVVKVDLQDTVFPPAAVYSWSDAMLFPGNRGAGLRRQPGNRDSAGGSPGRKRTSAR